MWWVRGEFGKTRPCFLRLVYLGKTRQDLTSMSVKSSRIVASPKTRDTTEITRKTSYLSGWTRQQFAIARYNNGEHAKFSSIPRLPKPWWGLPSYLRVICEYCRVNPELMAHIIKHRRKLGIPFPSYCRGIASYWRVVPKRSRVLPRFPEVRSPINSSAACYFYHFRVCSQRSNTLCLT